MLRTHDDELRTIRAALPETPASSEGVSKRGGKRPATKPGDGRILRRRLQSQGGRLELLKFERLLRSLRP